MAVRIVMPRSVPSSQASRIMWCAWKRGYSSRAVTSTEPPGWLRVEFFVEVDGVDPSVLEAFEIELDDTLQSKKVRATFTGTGAWTEAA